MESCRKQSIWGMLLIIPSMCTLMRLIGGLSRWGSKSWMFWYIVMQECPDQWLLFVPTWWRKINGGWSKPSPMWKEKEKEPNQISTSSTNFSTMSKNSHTPSKNNINPNKDTHIKPQTCTILPISHPPLCTTLSTININRKIKVITCPIELPPLQLTSQEVEKITYRTKLVKF